MKKSFLCILIITLFLIIQIQPIVLAINSIEGENNNSNVEEQKEYDNKEKSQEQNEKRDEQTKNKQSEEILEEKNLEQQEEKDETNEKIYIQSENEQNTEEQQLEENKKNDIIIPLDKQEEKEIKKQNQLRNLLSQNNEKNDENEEEVGNIENEEFSVYIDNDGFIINPLLKNNIYYLFLPQEVNISNVIINYTGNVLEISAGIIKDNKTIANDFSVNDTISITTDEGEYTVTVLKSDLPSMTISLNNTTLSEINNGSKEIKYTGNEVKIKNPNNTKQDLAVSNVEIKGRGNYTWKLPKKGYQIKFNKKQSVLGMEKAKTWILIANYLDNSYARNQIAFDLAKEFGLDYTPDYRFVDLWVDGEYLGNYMITEKVQVNENRVNLVNEDGVLSELDNQYYRESDSWFSTNISKTKFSLKDSVADDEENENSISRKAFDGFKESINTFEYYLYSNDKNWNEISKLIDVDSFIKYYFIQELSEDPDGCRSSIFLYKDGKDDVIHIGPVWDYDSAFGNYTEEKLGGNPNIDYVINIQKYMDNSNNWFNKLFELKEFRKKVSDIFNNEIKPKLNIIKNKTYNNMEKSANMNDIVWRTLGKKSLFGRVNKNTYNEECEYLNNWIENRINYLDKRYNNDSEIVNIKYKTHIEDIGWEGVYSSNGKISGTSGQSKRLEAIIIDLDTFNREILYNTQIKYQVHAQDYGWMDWKNNGEIAGTEGQSKRLEAIRIQLNNSSKYSIKYRVHIQDIGWTDWVYDGEVAGTEGRSLRLEAIEIQIVEKNVNNSNLLKYKGHIENIGDTEYVANGQIMGTTGKGLRLEGLQIQVGNSLPSDISLEINEHIENIGWVYGLTEKEYIGTKGQALRLEALSLKLKGENAENYTIKYRVHVQDIGWQDWKKDGEISGTTGHGLRIEAIQILIEKK